MLGTIPAERISLADDPVPGSETVSPDLTLEPRLDVMAPWEEAGTNSP